LFEWRLNRVADLAITVRKGGGVMKAFERVLAASVLLGITVVNFDIIAIVYQATGWTMPTWLAWVLIGAAGVSVIISAIATFGVTIPAGVAYAILGADSVSL